MNALIITLFSASSAALSNLFFRKSCGSAIHKASISGYLVFFYLFSLVFAVLISPSLWTTPPYWLMMAVGAAVGICNVGVMALTAKALQRGPAALTYAFQSASCMFPALLLFLLFGASFGFSFTLMQLAGIALIAFGLFWGASKNSQESRTPGWLTFAIGCSLMQVLALSLIQGRCILFACDQHEGFLSLLATPEVADVWFMPAQFGAAFLLQSILFVLEKRPAQKSEILYGSLGGLANGVSTLLLLLGTKWALPEEKSILFPCFAVALIILCNLWACWFYRERFNFATNVTCAAGIFIGSL